MLYVGLAHVTEADTGAVLPKSGFARPTTEVDLCLRELRS